MAHYKQRFRHFHETFQYLEEKSLSLQNFSFLWLFKDIMDPWILELEIPHFFSRIKDNFHTQWVDKKVSICTFLFFEAMHMGAIFYGFVRASMSWRRTQFL